MALVVALAWLGVSAATAAAAPGSAELRFSCARDNSSDAQLLLRRRAGEIELLTRAGTLLAERRLARTSGVSIHGADGHIDNTLTIDLGGGPIDVSRGIRYDGGHGGYNTLVIGGGGSAGEKSIPSGPHAGVIEVDRTRVDYADIAPIQDTTPTPSFVVNLPSAGGPVSIANGPVLSGPIQTMTISGPGFESITLANKTNITINGAGGTNSFTSDVTLAPAGFTGLLTIDGSADSSNTAVFEATPGGAAAHYRGTTGDAVTVGGSGGTQAVAGNLSIDFASGSGSVTLDDVGDTTGRTVDVGPTQVSGMTPDAIAYAHTSQLTIQGGGGSDTFDVTPSATTTDSISGGGPPPPAFPGDQLVMELAGAATPALVGVGGPTGAEGAWLFENRLPVSFSAMDSLDPTAASISDATVNPGPSGITPATFTVDLLAPSTSGSQVSFATADGSATAAAGNYQPASGSLNFAPGQTSQPLTVNVPGTSAPGPTRSFLVNLSVPAGAEILRGQATGTILDTNHASSPTTSPKVTFATQSASVWREGKRLARISSKTKPPIGSTFSFGLNEKAAAKLTFTQRSTGRKVHAGCAAQTTANKRKPRCTRTITAGTLTLSAHQGTNRVYFDGRLSATKKLKPGRYKLNIVAANAQGQRSAPASLSFTIVK